MESQVLLTDATAARWFVEHATQWRSLVPDLAADAAHAIGEAVPDYRLPGRRTGLEQLALRIIGCFVERLIDPGHPMNDLLDLCHRVGEIEAHAGRTIDPWNAAARAAVGSALRRLDREPSLSGAGFASVAGIAAAQAFLDFVDDLTRAVGEGHSRVLLRATPADASEELTRLLISEPPTDVHQLRDAMDKAGWKEPLTVAAVALAPHSHRFLLPPDVLGAFATSRPFLVVPDPDGPGRGHALKSLLGGRTAALGPTVPLRQLGASLRWARTALHLAGQGALPGPSQGGLILAARHAPIILMSGDPMARLLVEQRLAPLVNSPAEKRLRLAETFLALIETGFNAKRASEYISVHPQTIRYRLRTLEHLFGEDLYAPDLQLEFHLYLRSWLASTPGGSS